MASLLESVKTQKTPLMLVASVVTGLIILYLISIYYPDLDMKIGAAIVTGVVGLPMVAYFVATKNMKQGATTVYR